MTAEQQTDNKKGERFVEDMGMLFEQWAMPRMAGRILGWLLVCQPPHQSAGQLAEALGASKGSISTNTRMLIQSGLLEKFGLPKDRNTYYQIVSNPISHLMHAEVASIRSLYRVAESGLELIADKNSEQYKRLENLIAMWRFFEVELPKLVDRFFESRQNKGEE